MTIVDNTLQCEEHGINTHKTSSGSSVAAAARESPTSTAVSGGQQPDPAAMATQQGAAVATLTTAATQSEPLGAVQEETRLAENDDVGVGVDFVC